MKTPHFKRLGFTSLAVGSMFALGLSGCETMPKSFEQVTNLVSNNSLVASKMEAKAIDTIPTQYSESPASYGKFFDLFEAEGQGEGILPPTGKLQTYLNALLAQVVKQSGVQGYDGQVYVLTDPEDYNMRASPQGNIFIPMGFLHLVKSEDALVFVIAHEFAHHVYGHFTVDLLSTSQKAVTSAYNNSMRYADQAQMLIGKAGGNLPGTQKMQNLRKAAYLIEKTDTYLLPLWGKLQEQQADLLAMDLTMAMGYNFDASLGWMPPLIEKDKEALERRKAASEQKRIAIMEAAADLETQASFKDQMFKLGQDVGGTFIDDMLLDLQAKHKLTEERNSLLADYFGKFHYEVGTAAPRVAPWNAVWNSKEVTRVTEGLTLAAAATKLEKEGKSKEAAANLAKAKKQLGDTYAYPHRVELRIQGSGNRGLDIKAAKRNSQLAMTGKAKPRKPDPNYLQQFDMFANAMVQIKAATAEAAAASSGVESTPGKRPSLPNPLDYKSGALPNLASVEQYMKLLDAEGTPEQKIQFARSIFDVYGRVNFMYPRMIRWEMEANNTVRAEKLNLECAALYPDVAASCLDAVKTNQTLFGIFDKKG